MDTASKRSRHLRQQFSAGTELTHLHTPSGGSWLLLYIFIGALLVLSGCRTVPVEDSGARSLQELTWQVLIIDAASDTRAVSDTTSQGAATDGESRVSHEADAARAVYDLSQRPDASLLGWYLGQHRAASMSEDGVSDVQLLRDYDHFVDVLGSVNLNDDQALLLFLSVDGVPEAGMRPDVAPLPGQVLTPRYLGELLEAAVGDQPAVILISADYSGMFAMSSTSIASSIIRASRVLMTSSDARSTNARDSAGSLWNRLLAAELNSAHAETSWRQLAVTLNRGVTEFEARSADDSRSEPQHWVPVRDAAQLDGIFRALE